MEKKSKTHTLTLIAIVTAVICILGPLSFFIPLSPVPITFATFAIYFSAYVLGSKKASISCLIYLLIGFAGVPVFSNFTSGPGKLLGPTGGYLIGYIFVAFISGFFVEHFSDKIYMNVIGMLISTVVLYTFGSLWLSYQSGLSFKAAIFAGAIPYIPGDIVKIILANTAGPITRKQLLKAGYIQS